MGCYKDMEGKQTFLYTMNHMNLRTSRLAGVSFGVIHAENEEQAMQLLCNKMGNNTYSLRLLDASSKDCEGYIGIPSGVLMAFE